MAVQSNNSGSNFGASASAQDYSGTTGGYTETRAHHAPGGTPNISGIGVANVFSRRRMTPKLMEYFETLDKTLESTFSNATAGKGSVRRYELTDPKGAQAYVTTVDGIRYTSIIIPASLVEPYGRFLPVSVRISPALINLQEQIGDVFLVNSYVIRDADLDRVDNMANYLLMDLAPLVNPSLNPPLSVLGEDGVELVVDTRVEEARAFENDYSPHAVRPKMDIGLKVTLRAQRDRSQQIAGQSLSDNTTAFMSIGAVVDIIGPFQDKFVPSIRRTNITSNIPNLASLMLAEVLATEYFDKRGLWKRPYASFSRERHNPKPNLGRLITDPTNPAELYFTPDVPSMEAFITANFTPPMQVIEVVEGHARVPDIALFEGTGDSLSSVIAGACQMFGISEMPQGLPAPAQPCAMEYIGVYGDSDGTERDTRHINYLDQVARQGSIDNETAQILLNYSFEAEARAAVIANLAGATSCTFLYRSTLVAIDPKYSEWLSRNIPNTVRLVSQDGEVSNFSQMGSFITRFTDHSGFTSVMHQSQRQNLGFSGYARRY